MLFLLHAWLPGADHDACFRSGAVTGYPGCKPKRVMHLERFRGYVEREQACVHKSVTFAVYQRISGCDPRNAICTL